MHNVPQLSLDQDIFGDDKLPPKPMFDDSLLRRSQKRMQGYIRHGDKETMP